MKITAWASVLGLAGGLLMLSISAEAAEKLAVSGAPGVPSAPGTKAKPIIDSRCALCHGAAGESASAIYPRLAAQHPDYLIKQLQDFRDGRRKGDTMSEMAKDLTDDQITELAAWFGSRPAAARRVGDTDLAAVGKYIFAKGNSFSGVAACASCHGEKGTGTHQLPRLAGQHPAYLETQLKEFGKRERTNDNAIMGSIASKLTELEMRAVTVYLGGLQ